MTSTLSHNQPDSTRHPTLFVGGTLLASLGLAFAIAAVVAPDFLLTLYRLAAPASRGTSPRTRCSWCPSCRSWRASCHAAPPVRSR